MNHHNSDGFTLVEVLVTLIVISLFAVTIGNITTLTVNETARSTMTRECTEWLQTCLHYELNDPHNSKYTDFLMLLKSRGITLEVSRTPYNDSDTLQLIRVILTGDSLFKPMKIERLVRIK